MDEINRISSALGAQNELKMFVPKRLGRLPHKTTRMALQFADFFKFIQMPVHTAYWKHKTALPMRSFGNNQYGDCTRAKQAVAIERMERIEQKRLVEITDEEVIKRYLDMTQRLYGGGDVGAYEDDALSEWRKPDLTIRDVKGNPFTIDAYLAINASDHRQLKAGIAMSGARGIPVCLNLPLAFANIPAGQPWDIPVGQAPVGDWLPGSWGGHSMWSFEYDEVGPDLDMTWDMPPQKLTWRAAALYLDEAHLVIDSVDTWRKQAVVSERIMNDIVDAVNSVSSYPIGGKK